MFILLFFLQILHLAALIPKTFDFFNVKICENMTSRPICNPKLATADWEKTQLWRHSGCSQHQLSGQKGSFAALYILPTNMDHTEIISANHLTCQ